MIEVDEEIRFPKLSKELLGIKGKINESLPKDVVGKPLPKENKSELSDFDLPIDNPWDMMRLLMKPDKFKDSMFHQAITKEFITSHITDRLSRAKVDADFMTMMSLLWHGSKEVWKIYHARMMETMLLSSAEGIIPWIEGATNKVPPAQQQQPVQQNVWR